jgi:hypothetical protein
MRRKNEQFINEGYINPYRKNEIKYWAGKWKVSFQTIRAAMDVTGCSNVQSIKNYLQRIKMLDIN